MKKPTKLQRMLNKLFPEPCSRGKRMIREVAGKTLAQAWASADAFALDQVLSESAVVVPKKIRCWCGGNHCHNDRTADEIRSAFKNKVPGKLRALYVRA